MKNKLKNILLILMLLIVPVCVYAKDPCKMVFGKNTMKMMRDAYNIMRFAVPILLVGLSSADFIKAVSGQNADDLKKATSKLGKRLVIAVIILVLPTLLFFVLDDMLGLNICKL